VTAQTLSLVPMVLAWAGVAYKLPAYWRNRSDPTVRAFWLSLLFLALALTVLVPSIARWIDSVTGLPNISRLLGNGTVLVAAWAVQVFVLLTLDYQRDGVQARVRVASWSLVGVLAVMTVLFILAPVHREVAEFWQRYGTAPFMLAYRLVYLAYLGLAVVNIVRHSWHYAGIADQPSLALGLRLVAIGGVLGGAYVIHEGLRAAAQKFGLHAGVLDSDTITRLLIASSVGLMVAGVTMPAWGPRLKIPALYHWFSRRRAYRQLYPLWRDLYRVNPEIALIPPRSQLADAVSFRDLDFRLYRRVVEIRDGSLALRSYLDPALIEEVRDLCRAANLSHEETVVNLEAATIAATLQARKAGQPERANVPPDVYPLESHGGSDVASEAETLVRVAQYYRHSPVVRTIVAAKKSSSASWITRVSTPTGRR
jgi:hypothetical protein